MGPDFFVLFFILFFVAAVLGYLALFSWRSNQRHVQETDLMPLYETTCQGYLGGIPFKGVSYRLRMYKNHLVIASFRHILINYDDIDTIVPFGNDLFGRGIIIKHHDSSAPALIRLAANPKKVLNIFERYKESAI